MLMREPLLSRDNSNLAIEVANSEQRGDKCGLVVSTLVYVAVFLNIAGMSYIVWNNIEILDTLVDLSKHCYSDAMLARTLADLLAISFIVGLGSLLNNMVSIKMFCFGAISPLYIKPSILSILAAQSNCGAFVQKELQRI